MLNCRRSYWKGPQTVTSHNSLHANDAHFILKITLQNHVFRDVSIKCYNKHLKFCPTRKSNSGSEVQLEGFFNDCINDKHDTSLNGFSNMCNIGSKKTSWKRPFEMLRENFSHWVNFKGPKNASCFFEQSHNQMQCFDSEAVALLVQFDYSLVFLISSTTKMYSLIE